MKTRLLKLLERRARFKPKPPTATRKALEGCPPEERTARYIAAFINKKHLKP